MDLNIMKKIQDSILKNRPEVKVGDTVKLHMRVKEGDKERNQIFEGVVIQKRGSGVNATITVRKMSMGVGVERIVPVHAPTLSKIEVVKRGTVRRSKLYYMKDRIGKKALKVGNIKDVYFTDEAKVEPVVEDQPLEVAQEQ